MFISFNNALIVDIIITLVVLIIYCAIRSIHMRVDKIFIQFVFAKVTPMGVTTFHFTLDVTASTDLFRHDSTTRKWSDSTILRHGTVVTAPLSDFYWRSLGGHKPVQSMVWTSCTEQEYNKHAQQLSITQPI